MVKKLDLDVEFFFRLSCLYDAMTLSATAPVVVPTDLNEPFSHIFYDCSENENKALETMRERIKLASNDIANHFNLHQRALERFYDIEDGINHRNRKEIVFASYSLVSNVSSYSYLVKVHKERLGNKAFLEYPYCVRGHYFHVKGLNFILEKSFNVEQSFKSAKKALLTLSELTRDFRIGDGRIMQIKISENKDMGEGFADNSFRGRLELNKELLRRVGLIV